MVRQYNRDYSDAAVLVTQHQPRKHTIVRVPAYFVCLQDTEKSVFQLADSESGPGAPHAKIKRRKQKLLLCPVLFHLLPPQSAPPSGMRTILGIMGERGQMDPPGVKPSWNMAAQLHEKLTLLHSPQCVEGRGVILSLWWGRDFLARAANIISLGEQIDQCEQGPTLFLSTHQRIQGALGAWSLPCPQVVLGSGPPPPWGLNSAGPPCHNPGSATATPWCRQGWPATPKIPGPQSYNPVFWIRTCAVVVFSMCSSPR